MDRYGLKKKKNKERKERKRKKKENRLLFLIRLSGVLLWCSSKCWLVNFSRLKVNRATSKIDK